MSSINITGMDKVDILQRLYNKSRLLGLGFLQCDPRPMFREEAEELLKEGPYFDCIKGRVMKIDLSGDELRTDLYDRDNGYGAAKIALFGVPLDKEGEKGDE